MDKNTQKMNFEAETRQLLDLMIHSLYSNKEVFLREIISNASDALDKVRFEALTNSKIEETEGVIKLSVDKDKRILEVNDNGIGMSREEVIKNIGTIARSGTQELLANLKKAKADNIPTELIGQFGVGFYACFMAADKVEIITRRAGEDSATRWEYAGEGQYTVSDTTREEHGTTVRMHLKDADPEDGLDDFIEEFTLKNVVRKYSDFVRYPITLPVTKTVPKKDGKENETEEVTEIETLNSMKAIWRRPEKEVTDDERTEFYKHISHDWTEPLLHFNLLVEGRLEYRAMLFLPSHAPFDLFSQAYKRGLQLYVRNVKIMDNCEELLPEYLRFVKGVVDAEDLPLNVSREMLQNNRMLAGIKKALTKKTLDTLAKLKKDDSDKYNKMWEQFGAVIKEGISSDFGNKDKIVELLLFQSSNDTEKLTSLAEYKDRMKVDQDAIYYMAGEAREAVENSPHIEAFAKKGFEVLFLTDPVDEFMVSTLTEFEGKKLKSIGKGEVDLDNADAKEELEKKNKDWKGFLESVQKALDTHVKEVRLSNRLTTSPACLVGAEGDMSPHIQRLFKQSQMAMPESKRIMELNPTHEVIEKLKTRFDISPENADIQEAAELLLGQALLAESAPLPDPAKFAGLVAKLMTKM